MVYTLWLVDCGTTSIGPEFTIKQLLKIIAVCQPGKIVHWIGEFSHKMQTESYV